MGENAVTGIDWGFVIAASGLGLTLYMALCSVFYFQVLKHEDTRNDFFNKINDQIWLGLYRKLVKLLLDRLQTWFGNRLSLQAFLLCLILAFAYPVIFFIWAYSWGNGSHELAGAAIFDPDSEYRNWYLPGAIIYMVLMQSLFLNVPRIDEAGSRLFLRWFNNEWADRGYRVLCALMSALIITAVHHNFWVIGYFLIFGYFFKAIAGAFAIATTIVVVGAVAGAFVFAVAFAFAVASMRAVTNAVAVSGAVSGAGTGSLLHQGNYLGSLTIFILLIMLPLVNAFLDWISWAFSRLFLERASKEDRISIIIFDIAADLFLAIIFMLGLCLLIPAGAEALNLLYGQFDPDAHFDWHSLAESARDDPWGEGLMVTLMILSTLIPTVIHIVLALIALVLQSFMGNPIVRLLKEHEISQSNFPLFGVTGLVTAYFVGILVAIGCLYQFTVWAFSFNVSKGLYDMTMLVWG